MTWDKQCRKRKAELEVGPPAFRYSCRNTVERLNDKVRRDPISSEVSMLAKQCKANRRVNAQTATDSNSPRRKIKPAMNKAAKALKAAANKNRSSLALPSNYKRQDKFYTEDSESEEEKKKTNNQRLLEH